MPNIFQFIDYREFLKARYAAEKEKNPAFSHRFFARIAGLASSGFLKMVIDGKRNLTISTMHKFIKALKFSTREASYFETMVLYNQSVNDKERDTYYERLCTLRPKMNFTGIEKDQYEFFTQRYYVFIREMVALSDFREDHVWIAKHVIPRITPTKAEQAIKLLLRLGFLKRDKNGKLEQSDATLTTPIDLESATLYQLHRSMLDLTKEAIRIAPPDLRDITSLTIPLSKKCLLDVKKKLLNFKEELADWVNKRNETYHEVFQLNIQLFPVTDTKNPYRK